jgi:hypothetical protein
MIHAEDYIYNKSAIARMLKISVQLVVKVEKWPINSLDKCSVVFVMVKGRRPRFLKKLDFLCHFADWRRSQSKELVVDRLMPNKFAVINEKKKSKYVLTIRPDNIVCTCEDYKNQIKFLRKAGVCKHGYAVLKKLGIDQFSQYIKENNYEKTLEDYKKEHAQKLKVERLDAYRFSIQDSFKIYCDLQPETIKCSCSNSSKFCTHGYAILNYLGFTGSQQIKDYQLSFEWIIEEYMNQDTEEMTAEQLERDQAEEMEDYYRQAREDIFGY